ncbi:FtsK/SpoIIIE domain-containing protein [Lactobacillus sp.]|uniref:FtsK/SpoIIIE domain-containing protein n=1 Tax=Lactobacillus sp. TaxID=1591 RepID=UPI0019A71129|nr:FtsK/SpoIIIE domain-containing protein [Lactobacillus sp.]MBD5430514.1 cell division protein FtsK [Lactobacillus sp.]MBD5430805.1 cell division protein FtsK [Lactobacillus sp.]
MTPKILHAIFYWILPLSIALGCFFIFLHFAHRSFEKADVDRIWKVTVKVGIGLGILAIIYALFTYIPFLHQIVRFIQLWGHRLLKLAFIGKILQSISKFWHLVIKFISSWLPVYLRAFVLIWIPAGYIWVQSLIWRIKFSRAANIICRVVIFYPYLCFKYLLGYQTPFFDYIQTKLYVAKIKENVSDSYFEALQGIDDTGKPFDNGQGGTERIQKIKAAAISMRQTRATVKTAHGVRHAQLIIRNSREVATDQVIEQQLKGLGLRLSAPSIRFQKDPVLNTDKGGYIFDSDVQYNASDQLGSWQAIFFNPFSNEHKISTGGEGSWEAIKKMYRGMLSYFIHLTPAALYERMTAIAKNKYTPDTSSTTAKYKAQQNLDLSVVPEPVDPDSGETVAMLKDKALKAAHDRISDVTDALIRYKINVSFNDVEVGGNTAVYRYTLSRSANIPTDWKRIQEGLANLLKTTDIPIIRTEKGNLLVTMVNGVNIPVDFREMIKKRPKGLSEIISGAAGLDAMGNVIDFVLGDKNPHAMLFGKTGTGKTVLIMDILYSIMSVTDPKHLRIAYIDGKGNSFEFMRTDNPNAPSYHPNPFVYAQPADGSGDIEYARALVQHMVRECRRRIDLFKRRGVSKLAEFNKKYPDEALYEILFVCDEFSALTDTDDQLKASELADKGMTDAFEYLAKMARSVGIRMILANQTARKEKVPGRITANITGRISLGVAEPIESDIALPDSNVAVNLITQPGEFYSAMHGARNVQHGNAPYLSDDTMYALNDSLEKRFGHHDYVFTREQIMKEMDDDSEDSGANDESYAKPNNIPTVKTPVDELIKIIDHYPEWAVANPNLEAFTDNEEFFNSTPNQSAEKRQKVAQALREAQGKAKMIRAANIAQTRKSAGSNVAAITHGVTGDKL